MIKETLALIAVFLSIAASAQKKVLEREESVAAKDSIAAVKVFSNRKQYTLLSDPMPITIVSKEQIERTVSSNTIAALVAHSPGFNAVSTGPNISKPFIRGLGYNRVLTLYDGIRQEGQQWGDEHGIEVDGYNIAGAEIVKGPASTLYGSDALAGVVRLTPLYPLLKDNQWHGTIQSEYQSNNNLVGNSGYIGYNGKTFFAAASGSYKLAKNYRNAVDERVYNTNFREANAALVLGYHLKKGYVTLNGTLYHNLQGIPDGSRDSLSRKFTKQVEEGEMDNMTNRTIVSEKELNTYSLSPLHQLIKHYRIYSKLFKEMNRGSIHATLAFQQNTRIEYSHPTASEQAGMGMRLQTFNYDFRIDKQALLENLHLSIGANGMYQLNKNQNATDFPIPDYKLADEGMFAFGKWHKEKWTISGGLRLDIRHIQWKDFYIISDPATGFDRQAAIQERNQATKQFSAFSKNYSGFSASLGTTYKANNILNLKFNIARGYRVPNMTELASNGLDPGAHIVYLGNTSFRPEFSLQQDLGLNARFKDMDVDFSLFNNRISNYIFLSMKTGDNGFPIMDPQGNKTYQYEQSKAQLYGAEAFIAIHPTFWKAFSCNTSFATVFGFNRSSLYKNKGINGEYLPLIPPTKMASSLYWTFFEQEKGVLHSLNMQYDWEWDAAQQRFLGLNGTETKTNSYTLHDLGIYSTWKGLNGKTLSFLLMVNNIFDKVYQSNMSRLKYLEYYSSSPNGRMGIYNMGRNIAAKLIVPF
ncbi:MULTISPECIES: TonB-dependent receptor plug domain-containing protein [Chitinophagaceae]